MRKVAAFLLIFTFALCSLASAEDLDGVIKGIVSQYKNVKDISASFVQETKVKTLGRNQVKSGKVMFKRPGMMRWDYEKPEKQQLITDGASLWVYNPADKNVFLRQIDKANSTKILIQMLSGTVDVKKNFFAKLGEEKDGMHVLVLRPKEKGAPYEKAVLYLIKDSFKISKIEVTDLYGNLTTTTLSDIKYNSNLKDSLFIFTPKPGIEVISAPVME